MKQGDQRILAENLYKTIMIIINVYINNCILIMLIIIIYVYYDNVEEKTSNWV